MEYEKELQNFIVDSFENIPGLLDSIPKQIQSQTENIEFVDQVDGIFTDKEEIQKEEDLEKDNAKTMEQDKNQFSHESLVQIGANLRRISVDYMDSSPLGLEATENSFLSSFVTRGTLGNVVPFMFNKAKTVVDDIAHLHLEMLFFVRRVFRRVLRSVVTGLLNFSQRILPHLEDDEVD